IQRQRRLWRIAGRRFRRRRRRGRRTSPGGGRRRTSRAFSTGACDDTRTRNSLGWRRPRWASEEEGACQESSSQEGSGKEKGGKEAGQKSGQKAGRQEEGQTREEEKSGEEAGPESGKEERRPQERPPLTIQGNHQDDGGSAAWLPASAISLTLLFWFGHDRFRFDFHEHFWRHQRRDRHHGARGTNVAETLAVSLSNFFPIRNVGKEHARPNHIFQ